MSKPGKVYLIPTVLYNDAMETIPHYIVDAIRDCGVFFVEQEKTARRFIKRLWKDFVVDDQQWFTIHKAEDEVKQQFIALLKAGHHIAIISEAGCPGIADPGQILVHAAQQLGCTIQPLVGPSSILLALMASGLHGQRFQFHGYLPIEASDRRKKIRELEQEARKYQATQLFIETPYRNNALLKDLLEQCEPDTLLCIATDITAPTEFIRTKRIGAWKKEIPELHKRPTIFLIGT